MHKKIFCSLIFMILFFTGCVNNEDNENNESLLNSESEQNDDIFDTDSEQPFVQEIIIEDKSELKAQTLSEDFITKYDLEFHLGIAIIDGVAYYDRIISTNNSLMESEFELIAFDLQTGEKNVLYHFKAEDGGFYQDFTACEDNAFWVTFGEDYWKIMRFNFNSNEIFVMRESDPSPGIEDSLPVLFRSYETYFFWNEYPWGEIGNCMAYDTRSGEILELSLPERYAESPYFSNACVGDSVFYIKKSVETGQFSIAEINIKSNELLSEIKIHTKAIGVYCNGDQIMWQTSFNAGDLRQLYVYDIKEGRYYMLNNANECARFQTLSGDWALWKLEKSGPDDNYFLNLKTWEKYVFPEYEGRFRNIRRSVNGDIFLWGDSDIIMFDLPK